MDPFDGVVDVQRELLVDYNEVIRFFPNSTGTGTRALQYLGRRRQERRLRETNNPGLPDRSRI
jgi:hypothetical protein